MSLQIRGGHHAVRVTSFTESSVDTEGPRVHRRDWPHHPQCDGRVSATQTGALASTVNQFHRRQATVDQEEGLEDIQGQLGQGRSRQINVHQLRPRRETDCGTGTSFYYEGNVVSVRRATTFYIHFYHHDAIDTAHCGNERMTLNFLIAQQNLTTITSWWECYWNNAAVVLVSISVSPSSNPQHDHTHCCFFVLFPRVELRSVISQ